jgi:iron complex outermembrane receptor protein
MFYKSPIQQGNPGLKPEEALTVEAGIKYNNSFFNGYISAFRRWGYDLIDWVKDPSSDSTVWRSTNHTQINFTGMECSLTFTPSNAGISDRIQAFRISYAFLKADSNLNNMLSKYALDYLRHQITSSIDFKIAWKLFNSSRLTYHDRSSTYQDNQGDLVAYEPFWLFDSKIYWKEKNWTVYAEATNIFNTAYYDFGGIIQPGIWFTGGFTVDLDYN